MAYETTENGMRGVGAAELTKRCRHQRSSSLRVCYRPGAPSSATFVDFRVSRTWAGINRYSSGNLFITFMATSPNRADGGRLARLKSERASLAGAAYTCYLLLPVSAARWN